MTYVFGGVERVARVVAVAVSGHQAKLVLITSQLDASQSLTVLLPTTAVAASDLRLETRLRERGVEHLDEVGGLAAVGLHGGVGRVEIGLIEEANIFDGDAIGRVVLNVLHDLVGVRLPPVATGTRRAGYTT